MGWGWYSALDWKMLVVALILLTVRTSHATCSDFAHSSITCQLLFDHFQSALLNRHINLYNLRETFLPLTQPAPSLVNVSYHVTITPLTNKPCPGSEEATNNSSGLLPANSTTIDTNFAWTSKNFYTIFHPALVNRLQPQLLHTFLSQLEASTSDLIAVSWDGVGPLLTVELDLGPVLLPCLAADSEIYASLGDITSLVGHNLIY